MRSVPVRLRGRWSRRAPGSVPAAVVDHAAIGAAAAAPTDAVRAWDVGRTLDDKACYSACYAPAVSLYFDQHGDVRACNLNLTGVLGNIRLAGIREIWEGVGAQRLRDALAEGDLSAGCAHCEWQEANGDGATRYSRSFDQYSVPEPVPTWPKQMEFALTNACNLQCEMCTGWNSSAIRAHREKLPPIQVPYGDEFFEELAEFLPHLEHVTVLGGEPFLGRETLRLLDMLAELPVKPTVWATTNGTQWSTRIQRICERVPMTFEVSIDGITPETFESIRIGASLDAVLANVEHYKEYAVRHGTRVGIAYCLMPANWHEFFDLLRYAEDHELDFVNVKVVTFPPAFSMYHLGEERLGEVVEALEEIERTRGAELGPMRPVWLEQLESLRVRLASGPGGGAGGMDPLTEPWGDGGSGAAQRAEAALLTWNPGIEPVTVRADATMAITSVVGPLHDDPSALLGSALPVLIDRIGQAHRADLSPTRVDSGLANEVAFEGVADGKVVVRLRAFLFSDGDDLVVQLGVQASTADGDDAAAAAPVDAAASSAVAR